MRRNRLAGKCITLIAVLVMLAPGCTAIFEATAPKVYEGPTLPREEIAVVTTKFVEDLFIFWPVDTKILAIDGKRVDGKSAEVLPGPHELVLGRGTAGSGFYPITDASRVHFNARAGALYVARSDWYQSRAWFWVEDDATSEVVGGNKPPPND